MKIIPTQQVAGAPVGQPTEVPDEDGRWLVEHGYAVEEPKPAEPTRGPRPLQ